MGMAKLYDKQLSDEYPASALVRLYVWCHLEVVPKAPLWSG